MEVQLVIAAVLLLCAGIVYVRPQSIATMGYRSDEQRSKVEWKKVRRTAGGGLALLALLLGGGSLLLAEAGVDEATLTVLGIVLVFVGCVVIVARVETFNRNR